MAPVDLPRAQRIADTMIDPYLIAQAYGVIAQAIARSEPRAARESIERAFGVLEKLAIARETARPGGKRSPRPSMITTGNSVPRRWLARFCRRSRPSIPRWFPNMPGGPCRFVCRA